MKKRTSTPERKEERKHQQKLEISSIEMKFVADNLNTSWVNKHCNYN
jgi:hypothetical protein